MSKEAMKLALEALELNNDEWKSLADSGDCGWWRAEDQSHYKQTNEAITALREALAEQPAQQEPEWYHFVRYGDDCFVPYKGQAPEQATRLYTTPQSAQRTWVGLIRGVRVEGDTVVITVKGGNDAARELCAALLEEKNT